MLIDAITRGRLYQVKFLLESGAVNVNVTDHYGQTPLMKAIQLEDRMHHTRYKIVRLLLDHGARVNVADKAGRTALMLAVIYGQKEIAEKILNSSLMDIDLNAGDYEGNTALIHSALEGHDMITSILVTSLKRFGLDIDKKNHRGFTAMLEAVRHGREQCARVLHVEGGASLTIRDPETYMNAEEWAVENELLGLIELFEKNKHESTPVKTVDAAASRKTSDEDVNVAAETANLELPANDVDVRSRPQSPRDVSSRPGSTRKQASKNVMTVPRIMRNLRNQEEQQAFDVSINSRPSTPRDLTQNSRAAAMLQENDGKAASKAGSCSNREGTLLSKRRNSRPRVASAGLSERSSNAKTEIQRLLCLYGVQNSMTYRRGYDPASLPPSGMWPDPNAVNLSDSIENINAFGGTDVLGELSFGVGRRSVLSSACSRRMSIVGGNAREGRRMSIISQGNLTTGRPPVTGRKMSTAQQLAQPKNLLEPSGRRPGERRMSMAPKANIFEKPVLRRMNTSTSAVSLLSPLVG